MTDFSNIAYAGLNLSFDRQAFIEEYDSLIMPNSKPFIAVNEQWGRMESLNKYWNVMSEETFLEYDKIIQSGGTSVGDGIKYQWQMVNMMQAKGEKKHIGGAFWRHRNRFNETFVKPEFEDSIIRKWIVENIPHERIFGIHCVSIDPGGYASIHRDMSWKKEGENPGSNNGWFKQGFVVVCLNISTGGQPLLWALDHEKENPRKVGDEEHTFIISDYFLHAVPIVQTLRRQIRVSVVPTPELADLIKQNTAVIIPPDYHYSY